MNKKFGVPLETPTQTVTSSHNCQDGYDCQAEVLAEAVITLPSSQIGYVQALPLKTGHSDHTLKQAWRDKTHAVYKHFGSHGQFIGWEAILIKVAPARRIFGKDYPEREVYPSNEDFGRYAVSVGAQYDLEYAIEKAQTLKVSKCRRENRQKPTGTDTETYWNRNKHKLKPKHKLKLKPR